jgi:hypothetical protein
MQLLTRPINKKGGVLLCLQEMELDLKVEVLALVEEWGIVIQPG